MSEFYSDGQVTLYHGEVRDVLAQLPAESVQCVVTSPPYWGLRDYGVDGQLGIEPTPEAYVDAMVDVFRHVRRVLRDDGTLWLNIGDSYGGGSTGTGDSSASTLVGSRRPDVAFPVGKRVGVKPKDLVGIPWMLAFALRADGWWLRQDIIWSKPNPMPESVRDRCTKAHEYLFLLSKSARYWYDADAIAEPVIKGGAGSTFTEGKTGVNGMGRVSLVERDEGDTRNRRSVWQIATAPFPEAHFATFPPALVEPCILAGSREGDTVLDPFIGSGTTAMVARNLGRRAIGIDLNAEYLAMAKRRVGEQLALLDGAR